jgi:hypothetical protein
MRISFCLVSGAVILFLLSCDSKPDVPKRSQQFIDDSTFIVKYEKHIDSLYAILPKYVELEKIKCPSGCFDDLKLFDENHPFVVFEPEELNREADVISYFRFDRVQGTAGRDFDPYFGWRPELRWESDYATYADKFRNLIGWNYICVFYTDSAKYQEPKVDEKAQTFTPGKMSGCAVIVDFNASKIVCAFKVSAESSEEVTYEALSVNGGDPVSFGQYTGVRVDLWLNLAKEIENKLYDSRTDV